MSDVEQAGMQVLVEGYRPVDVAGMLTTSPLGYRIALSDGSREGSVEIRVLRRRLVQPHGRPYALSGYQDSAGRGTAPVERCKREADAQRSPVLYDD